MIVKDGLVQKHMALDFIIYFQVAYLDEEVFKTNKELLDRHVCISCDIKEIMSVFRNKPGSPKSNRLSIALKRLSTSC